MMDNQKNNCRLNLTNKTALITGGGGFLGSEHAIALARNGARIILIDIDKNGLKRAQDFGSSPITGCKKSLSQLSIFPMSFL